MKISKTTVFAFSAVIGVLGVDGRGVRYTQKPTNADTARDEALSKRHLTVNQDVEIPFGTGTVCPSLPAGRNPSTPAANDGWSRLMGPNDDGSQLRNLPFSFDFFGTIYEEMFVNNNGNISFENPSSSFSSSGFPSTAFKMIAPFWADVDTRSGNGIIWSKDIDAETTAIAWDHVGYYSSGNDRLNTFQVMLSGGANSDMGIGNTVCFCYYEMQWTAGSASGGSNGLGGTPATAGVNVGDGEQFSLVGLFDEEAEVNALNAQDFCFSIAGSGPAPVDFPASGSMDLACDEILINREFTFDSLGRQVTLQVSGTLPGMSVNIQDGTESATAAITWTPTVETTGTLVFTAEDNAGELTTEEVTFNAAGPCSPDGGGDPHFTTWSGEKFSFHGECDLVLIQDPSFFGHMGLHVHGRTKIHHDWSAFEAAAVKIGDDIFEIHGKNEYWINGEPMVKLPAKFGRYTIKFDGKADAHDTRYAIQICGSSKLVLKAFDEFVWVSIEGINNSRFKGSKGLLGKYAGEMVARDGHTIITDPNKFGQEWQVRDTDPQLFHIAEGPQYPDKCILPSHPKFNMTEAAILPGGDAKIRAAKEACGHVSSKHMSDCLADVLATDNLDIASAY